MKVSLLGLCCVGCFVLSGCSVYMEAHRPTPVNTNQFVIGEDRTQIIGDLGRPLATVNEQDGEKCDVYRLYTKGLNGAEKTGIAVGEGLADVATFGLTEILLTPAEGATENKKHPVTFCYKHAKLASVELGKAN